MERGVVGRLSVSMALGIVACIAAPSVASAAAATVVVGGRITFRDDAREVKPEEAERLRWGHIVVEIRNGWEVFSARPDAEAMFTITGPPGRYRLEYIRVGQLAEFFVPHEAVVAAGGVTCLGTIEVQVKDITKDLGNNTASRLNVRNDCSLIGSELARRAGTSGEVTASPPRPVPTPTWTPSPIQLLVAFRGSAAIVSNYVSSLRADFVLPLGKDGDRGQWLAGATLIHIDKEFVDSRWPVPVGVLSNIHSVWGGAVGAGYNYAILEMMAWAGATGDPGRGAHGPFAGASARIGSFLWGFGLRADWYPGTGDRITSFMVDISPFGLLGALL
jgi:hypothetical protein